MTDVEIRVVSGNDSSIYSRSAAHRLVVEPDTPSSPPLTTKVLQIASGRRKSFDAKNDPEVERRSERRLASHPPTLDGATSTPTRLEAIKVDDLSSKDPTKVRKLVTPQNAANGSTPHNHSQDGGRSDGMISLDVSPPQIRKEYSPVSGSRLVGAELQAKIDSLDPNQHSGPGAMPTLLQKSGPRAEDMPEMTPSDRRRLERKPKNAKPKLEEKVEKSGSPPAERRRVKEPVVSGGEKKPAHRSRKHKEPAKDEIRVKQVLKPDSDDDAESSRSVRNVHHSDYSKLSVPDDEPVSDNCSSRRRGETDILPDTRIRLKESVDRKSKSSSKSKPTAKEERSKPETKLVVEKEKRAPREEKSRKAKSPPEERKSQSRTKSRDASPEEKKSVSRKHKPKTSRQLPADAPRIKVGGQQLKSREMETLDPSGDSLSAPGTSSKNSDQPSTQSESLSSMRSSETASSEVTSRRKIRSRQKAIDKGLDEAFEPGEFVPEDDEHLKSAVQIALEESRKQSVQEALEAGEDLNAKILESLTRPNAIEEVIEKMVSQRREKIQEEKRMSKRRAETSPKVEPARPGKRVEKGQRPQAVAEAPKSVKAPAISKSKTKANLPPPSDDEEPVIVEINEVEKNTARKKVRRVKTRKPRSEDEADELLAKTLIGKVAEVADSEENEDEAEEGLDGEEGDEEEEIVVKSVPVAREDFKAPRPRATVTVDQGFPKAPALQNPVVKETRTALPGNPISVSTASPNLQETEPLPAPKAKKAVRSKPALKKEVEVEEEVAEEEEVNVKLPKAMRKIRKGDKLDKADALGQQESIYDPLGVDVAFDDDDDSIGDDIYEESEEDEGKLTINEKKDEMLYRFKLVKEGYPGMAFPRITKKMKLAKMVRLYDHVMSRVKMKVKVRNFKIFLIGGMLLMQFLAKKVGADASGFTVNQMYAMARYEPFLRELSESDWTSFGVELPVMVRLPFFMAVNMGIFVIAKWIFKKTGKDYTAQFHKLYAQLTGGDDYTYIKDETGTAGLDAGGGDGEEGGGGGIFGILKSVLGMLGGGGGGDENRPKRGEAKGPPKYKRTKKAE